MKEWTFLLLSLLAFVAAPAHASTTVKNKAQLCQNAGLIIIGTVDDVDSSWTTRAYGDIIVSDVTFNVEAVVHGNFMGSTIDVPVLGGTVGTTRLTVGGMPNFEEGDRYLLLLHPRMGQPATILGEGAGAIRLDATKTLPSQSQLQDFWEENCDA